MSVACKNVYPENVLHFPVNINSLSDLLCVWTLLQNVCTQLCFISVSLSLSLSGGGGGGEKDKNLGF